MHLMVEMLKKHIYMIFFALTFSIKTKISFIIIVSFASLVWMCKVRPFKNKVGLVTAMIQELAFTTVTIQIPFVYHEMAIKEISDSLVYVMVVSSAASAAYLIWRVAIKLLSWACHQ